MSCDTSLIYTRMPFENIGGPLGTIPKRGRGMKRRVIISGPHSPSNERG